MTTTTAVETKTIERIQQRNQFIIELSGIRSICARQMSFEKKKKFENAE